jgi:hypothetical protein
MIVKRRIRVLIYLSSYMMLIPTSVIIKEGDCCLTQTQQFFSYIMLIFNEMMMRSALH